MNYGNYATTQQWMNHYQEWFLYFHIAIGISCFLILSTLIIYHYVKGKNTERLFL